jgi:hypothetical protein
MGAQEDLSMLEINSMKISLLALCFLCGTTAFAQAGPSASAMSAQASPIAFSSHEATASQHSMATEQNLLGASGYTWAQGERPLWEVAPVSHFTPLGDSARLLKKEHDNAKKAEFVWNNN